MRVMILKSLVAHPREPNVNLFLEIDSQLRDN